MKIIFIVSQYYNYLIVHCNNDKASVSDGGGAQYIFYFRPSTSIHSTILAGLIS